MPVIMLHVYKQSSHCNLLFTYNTDKTKYTLRKTVNIFLCNEKIVALKKKHNRNTQFYLLKHLIPPLFHSDQCQSSTNPDISNQSLSSFQIIMGLDFNSELLKN